MYRTLRRILTLSPRTGRAAALIALTTTLAAGLTGCDDATSPQAERANELAVTAPALVDAGQTFSLTVDAVGNAGTRPFGGFSGEVTLSASPGDITPSTITLNGGTGTADVTLSVADGTVTIEARASGIAGTRDISVGALQLLPGAAGDPAVEAIPALDFTPREEDYDDQHPTPDLTGVPLSFTVVLLALEPTATVGDVNALLNDIGASIAGGIPGREGSYSGLLTIRVPLTSHAEMDALITRLNDEAVVFAGSRDKLSDTQMIPNSNNLSLGGWLWDAIPVGGNWGFELARVPQMWNLNAALQRRGNHRVATGVYDNGFYNHEDLVLTTNFTPGIEGIHGTHVAGTVGAQFDNGKGVDGVSPYALVHGYGSTFFSTVGILDGIEKLAAAGCRVINMSIGNEWPINPNNSTVIEALLSLDARVFKSAYDGMSVGGGEPPLLVMAAGNQGAEFAEPVQARLGSAQNYAAFELGSPHIIVVEAVELGNIAGAGSRRAVFSNVGGHVSAPGHDILSTAIPNTYINLFGTSMAAPHVTGLASYLLSVDPSLANVQVRDLIVRNAKPADDNAGFPAANRIDAFDTAMDIDAIRSNRAVLRLLLDIDDGTPDGNLRVDPETGTDFTDTDDDGNGGIGDGRIDMSDFRRWRDLFLDYAEVPGRTLDGSASHTKRDLNGNGKVGAGDPQERFYPLADFNGDGQLDTLAAREMSGALFGFGELTDLEVLSAEFVDAYYDAADLPDLVMTGDIQVDMSDWVDDSRFTNIFSKVEIEGFGIKLDQRFHRDGERTHVYTLPADDGPYEVTAWGLDAFGDTVCIQVTVFELSPGEDQYFSPPCPGVSIDITAAEFAERGVPTPVLVRAGIIQEDGTTQFLPGTQLALNATGGSVAATQGTTNADGFFNTEATIGANANEMVVFVTATDPSSGASAVASATVQPIESGGNSSIIVGNGAMSYSSKSSAGVSDVSDSQFIPVSVEIPDALELSGDASTSASASKELSSASATGSATADYVIDTQNSDSLMVVTATFMGNAHGEAGGPLYEIGSAKGSGSAQGSVRFEFTVVGDPVAYFFTCSLTEIGGGTSGGFDNAFFILEDENRNRLEVVSEGSRSSSGTLQPGAYTFWVSAGASAASNAGASSVSTQSGFELLFAVLP